MQAGKKFAKNFKFAGVSLFRLCWNSSRNSMSFPRVSSRKGTLKKNLFSSCFWCRLQHEDPHHRQDGRGMLLLTATTKNQDFRRWLAPSGFNRDYHCVHWHHLDSIVNTIALFVYSTSSPVLDLRTVFQLHLSNRPIHFTHIAPMVTHVKHTPKRPPPRHWKTLHVRKFPQYTS